MAYFFPSVYSMNLSGVLDSCEIYHP